MANRWNNPETKPLSCPATIVTCVECGKKVQFGDSHAGQQAPYFVCVPCGRKLRDQHGGSWPDALERRLCAQPLRSYQRSILNGCPPSSADKAETVRLLSGTPMPPDRSSVLRDTWLAEVFKFWICDA